MKIKKCCCCLNVVQGAYLIAIFGAIRGVFYLGVILSIIFDGDLDDLDIKQVIEGFLLEIDCGIEDNECHDFIINVYAIWCVFIGTIFFITDNIILIVGLKKKRAVFILIWLIFEGITGSVSEIQISIYCLHLVFSNTYQNPNMYQNSKFLFQVEQKKVPYPKIWLLVKNPQVCSYLYGTW